MHDTSFFEVDENQRDDENLALMAIRDCERQFAAHLAVAADRNGEGAVMLKVPEGTKFPDPPPGSILSSFSSLLSDLPLYQGYGVIGQHVSKPIESTGNETTPTLTSIITAPPVDKPLNQLDASMLTKLFEEMTCGAFLPRNLDNIFGGIEANKKLSLDEKGRQHILLRVKSSETLACMTKHEIQLQEWQSVVNYPPGYLYLPSR
nr:unnamed protein product [Spirometra erinaceieuropaei]